MDLPLMNIVDVIDGKINAAKYRYLDAGYRISVFGPTVASVVLSYCEDGKADTASNEKQVAKLLRMGPHFAEASRLIIDHTVLGFLPGVVTKGWPAPLPSCDVRAIMVPGQREVFYLRTKAPTLLWKFNSSIVRKECNAVLVPFLDGAEPRIAIVTIKDMAIGDALVVLKKQTQRAHVIAVCPLREEMKQDGKRRRETETDEDEAEMQPPTKRGRTTQTPDGLIDATVVEPPTPAEHVRAILRYQGLPEHVIETLAAAGLETPALLRFVPRLPAYAALPALHRIAIDSLLAPAPQ